MQPANINIFEKPSHKKRNILIIVATIFVIIVLIPILILGWMGLVPGLSDLMGSSKPKDLGVHYNQTDYNSYKQKTNIELKPYNLAPVSVFNSNEKTLLASPVKTNILTLSESELTAALNNLGLYWLPVKNIQTKINEGSLEISGSLDSSKINSFKTYLNRNGNINSDASNSIDWAQRFSNDAPIYLKTSASITDNILKFNLDQAQIGRLNIPLGELGQSLADSPYINVGAINFDAKQVKLTNGRLEFIGTYPSVIYIK